MWTRIEGWVQRYLVWWHGAGAESQYLYYRCADCRRLVTWNQIRLGGCRCMGAKVRPASLTRWEKTRLLMLPWTV